MKRLRIQIKSITNLALILALVAVLFTACKSSSSSSGNSEMDAFIDSLMNEMTVEEKAGQLTLYTSGWDVTGPVLRDDYMDELRAGRAGNLFNAHTVDYATNLQRIAVEETRLGIPLLFGLDVIHGYKTTFPIPLAEAASWDMDIIEKSAHLAAKEAASAGVNWTYNPMVDIARDPRWGRIAEGSGEDPYLGGLIGAAKVRGIQGTDLSDPTTILACVKHFAAYGASQAGRDYHTVDMSDRELRQNYLPPYKAALDAGATTVMTSFNEVDGVPASGNKYLMTEILRNEWGFDGFVVTDYTSINEMVPHGAVANLKEAAELAFNAGVQMDMQGGVYSQYIPELIEEGKIKESDLNDYVRQVLEMKYKLGLFEDPYRYLNKEREQSTLYAQELMDHSLLAGKESIVLLKNEPAGKNSENLLPLSKNTRSVALIGPLADNQKDMLGTWHVAGDESKVVTLLEGIKQTAPNVRINYARGAGFNGNDKSGFAEAIAAARRSDVVVMAIGEDYTQSGEAASRTEIGLPGPQQELIEAIHALGKPVVAVVMAGRPLTINWIDENIPAVMNAWHLGTMSGKAIAETLFGDHNPGGKLTITFPKNVGQIPVYYNMKNTGRPFDANNKYTSKYLDVSNEPLYPFGYGLSYTTFEYSNLNLSSNELSAEGSITVNVTVKNTGKYQGKEVVQLYIRDLVGSVTRPVKELKGFEKISLAPGESKQVSFTITNKDLEFYTRDMTFKSEPGDFKVFVGTNSVETLEADFVLK
ncbi:glycoside hydrolase family 3 N-terminal domain-containing protein [Roseivirga sp.]|jgi:beta-glucosidase|uniref:glycoside hydrolase family 3 N-terminal domain-containing protein n=1 Tax=Roseivirga sp. TaxID=1964215 RepID=UPI0023564B49|nr:glycoside hydrolase family 3 N-terminal domain-containing protein [Roseivirga sp.]